LSSETFGNTAVHTMSYNRRLQASQAKLSLGSSVLQQYDYGYGEFNTSTGAVDTSKNNGQIGKITGTIGTTTQWLQGFQYDELGRLKNVAEYQSGSMSSQTYSQGYTYDRYGNRFQSANTTLGLPAVSSSEVVASTNRFINSGSTPTTYDAAGNITTDTKFRGMNYSYDANGRMTFAETTAHSNQQTSIYDCAGQRVKTAVGSATRTMIYDIFGQDVADYSGSTGGTLERENIYRGGQLLATYEAGSSALKYVLTDVQGSTRALMNNNGSSSTVIARHDYLPFGEEISAGVGLRTTTQGYGATDTNRWKYGLTERDDTTGLDHTWWRKYENFAGRWTSPDPYNSSMTTVDAQSFNRYSYTQNDPVNLVDPGGLVESWNCTLTSGGWECGMTISVSWADELSAITGGPPEFGSPIIRPFVEPLGGGDPQTPRQSFKNFRQTMSQDCKDALKKAGLLGKVTNLANTAQVYDVNSLQNAGASKYVDGLAKRGETLGQWFNRTTSSGGAHTAVRVPRAGIYISGGESAFAGNLYLELHEMTHLAYPVGRDLDATLGRKLGLTKGANESWSDAVSRFFNSQCTKKTP
jgi:RHS repeat-associated protein